MIEGDGIAVYQLKMDRYFWCSGIRFWNSLTRSTAAARTKTSWVVELAMLMQDFWIVYV